MTDGDDSAGKSAPTDEPVTASDPDTVERSGTFRVYRVVDSVQHINLQAVGDPTLYTVYQSGYNTLQPTVDALDTGDLVEATLSGDPSDQSEAWRLTNLHVTDSVEMDFAVDVDLPSVATDLWDPDTAEPTFTTLVTDEERDSDSTESSPVAACGIQPREPLPNGAFVPNVLTGLLPLESVLQSVPGTDDPAAEVLFLDADPPDSDDYSRPFGVVVLFTETGTDVARQFREQYDCPRGEDSRPAFDPY
jgi:hypothetical protein